MPEDPGLPWWLLLTQHALRLMHAPLRSYIIRFDVRPRSIDEYTLLPPPATEPDPGMPLLAE